MIHSWAISVNYRTVHTMTNITSSSDSNEQSQCHNMLMGNTLGIHVYSSEASAAPPPKWIPIIGAALSVSVL